MIDEPVLKQSDAEAEGFLPLTYPYRRGEARMLLRALDLLKLGEIDYCLVPNAGGVEIWRKYPAGGGCPRGECIDGLGEEIEPAIANHRRW